MKNSSPVASSLAAIGSVLAASTCCLPIGTMWLAATAAGAGAVLDRYRPWLTGLSLVLIAYGFWQARRATQCSVGRRRLNFTLLGVALFFSAASFALPAWWTMGSHAVPEGQPGLVMLSDASTLASQWNASTAAKKVLVLLSPT